MSVKKKNRKQMDYILEQLKELSICEVADKYTKEIESVSTPLLKDLLQNKFTNGPDMNAVICLFDTLILSSEVKKECGLYHLSTTVQKWVKKMEQIDVKSAEAKVYISDILSGDIQVIIKTPKKKESFEDLLREYFIGVTEINKMRYYVPNFMYTLGAFIYPDEKDSCKNTFVIYEKIPGLTLEQAIRQNKITFAQFLGIFAQILLALEVAQRKIRFCHFDLHASNIILRPITKPYTYTVVLDTKKYTVTAHDYVPVLIDFGMASVTSKTRTIGSYYFSRFGMMNYLVQGADMYKLLFYCVIHSKNELHRQLADLFIFYGRDDPYQILIKKQKEIKKITKEFAKQITFTKAATYTPLNFLSWLLSHVEYGGTLTRYILVADRNIFFPVKFSSSIQQYADIFQHSDQGKEFAIDLALDCTMSNVPSYVLLEYTKSLLDMYDANLHSETLKKRLKYINKMTKNKRRKLFQQDKSLLMSYTSVKLPNKMKIRDYINTILNIKINHKKDVNQLIKRFLCKIKFYKELSPYFQFMYTIKELHLDERYKTYRTFLTSFMSSPQYQFYQEIHGILERTVRWSITLIESK